MLFDSIDFFLPAIAGFLLLNLIRTAWVHEIPGREDGAGLVGHSFLMRLDPEKRVGFVLREHAFVLLLILFLLDLTHRC